MWIKYYLEIQGRNKNKFCAPSSGLADEPLLLYEVMVTKRLALPLAVDDVKEEADDFRSVPTTAGRVDAFSDDTLAPTGAFLVLLLLMPLRTAFPDVDVRMGRTGGGPAGLAMTVLVDSVDDLLLVRR